VKKGISKEFILSLGPGKLLPPGAVVSSPPTGWFATPVSGVKNYYCGGKFYHPVFQGNTLVCVTKSLWMNE